MKDLNDFINKVTCGNCLDVMKEIPNNTVDLVLTDPPYNISSNIKVMMTNHPNSNSNERQITYDFGEWDWFESEEKFLEFTSSWMKECYRILKPTGNFVSFFSHWNIGDMKRIWEKNGGKARQILYIIKTNPKPRLRKVDFMQAVEHIFWGAKSDNGHTFNYNLGQHMNYVRCAVFYNDERTNHPTQKPEISIDWIIKYLSNPNDIVLDPFLGSGTTAVVSSQFDRRFIGIESSPEYCEIANSRLNPYLNQNKIKRMFVHE